MNENIGTMSVKIDADTTKATENIAALSQQIEQVNALRIQFWTGLTIKLAFALGMAGLVLAVFFALIYTFLRWVL